MNCLWGQTRFICRCMLFTQVGQRPWEQKHSFLLCACLSVCVCPSFVCGHTLCLCVYISAFMHLACVCVCVCWVRCFVTADKLLFPKGSAYCSGGLFTHTLHWGMTEQEVRNSTSSPFSYYTAQHNIAQHNALPQHSTIQKQHDTPEYITQHNTVQLRTAWSSPGPPQQ